jgi:uncharacterized protein YjbI with pentapeptide repeats
MFQIGLAGQVWGMQRYTVEYPCQEDDVSENYIIIQWMGIVFMVAGISWFLAMLVRRHKVLRDMRLREMYLTVKPLNDFRQKTREKAWLSAAIIITGGGLFFILAETVRANRTGFETKMLWDWMELLIIPLVLAMGAFYLNKSERAVERQSAEARAEFEREIAKDRQQENALQSYFDRMTNLLLKEKLRTTKIKEVRYVARTITITLLRGLDAQRKREVVQFLHEALLINKQKPVIDLKYADLTGAYLHSVNLENADLNHVDFARADLNNANLGGADLHQSSLFHADLFRANLSGANLADAELFSASLSQANLRDANLSGANLSNAFLSDANLGDANLSGARVSAEQLKIVKVLKGAIMPDGTKHE